MAMSTTPVDVPRKGTVRNKWSWVAGPVAVALGLGAHVVSGGSAPAIPILLGSFVTVRFGAAANQRMNTRQLRILFAIVFFVLGARLIIENAGQLL